MRRLTRLTPLFFSASALLLSCNDNTVGDDFLGVLDFSDVEMGAFAANPAPIRGYAQGKAVEYYDFGVVPTTTGPGDVPVALAQPMYWFFDRDTDQPLYSLLRDASGLVPGEDGLAQFDEGDPNRDCNTRYVPPYIGCRPSRIQHPVVGTIPGKDGYTGYWQVIKVRVPAGFEIDSIKSEESLKEAQYEQIPLRVVVHCPVVDLASVFQRSIANQGRVAARIQVWFKKQMGNCILLAGGDNADLKLGLPAGPAISVLDVMMDMTTMLGVPAMHAFAPSVTVSGSAGAVVTEVADSRVFEFSFEDAGYAPFSSMQPVSVQSSYTPGTYKAVGDLPPNDIGDITEHRALTVWGEIPACTMADDPVCTAVGLACNMAESLCAVACTDMGGECDGFGLSCNMGFCGPAM